jgi:hypothetical protein
MDILILHAVLSNDAAIVAGHDAIGHWILASEHVNT